MKKVFYFVISISFWLAGEATAQGPYFSQQNLSPLLYNPASPALRDEAALMLSYRNQQSGSQLNIQTASLNGMLPFYNKDKSIRRGGAGFGLMREKAEDLGSVVNQQAFGSIAYNLPFIRKSTIALGAQGAFGQQSFGLENIATGSQWVKNTGYDPSAGTGENFNQERGNYWSLGAGFLVYKANEDGEIRYQLGASANHLNRPEISFINGNVHQQVNYRAQASYSVPAGRKFSLIPEVNWQQQGARQLLGIGSVLKYKFENDNPFDPLGSGSLNFLARTNINEAVVFGLQLHQPGYIVGFSYDWGFSSSRFSGPGYHATEFGIALRKAIGRKPKATIIQSQSVGEIREFYTEKEKAIAENESADGRTSTEGESTGGANSGGGAKGVAAAGTEYKGEGVQFELKKDFKFAFNKAELNPEAKLYLDDLYELLQNNAHMKLKVVGHTDDIGTRKANKQVSEQRAQAVQEYLLSKGLEADRISAEGKGAAEPLLPNDTDENRSKNRRVEFILYTK